MSKQSTPKKGMDPTAQVFTPRTPNFPISPFSPPPPLTPLTGLFPPLTPELARTLQPPQIKLGPFSPAIPLPPLTPLESLFPPLTPETALALLSPAPEPTLLESLSPGFASVVPSDLPTRNEYISGLYALDTHITYLITCLANLRRELLPDVEAGSTEALVEFRDALQKLMVRIGDLRYHLVYQSMLLTELVKEGVVLDLEWVPERFWEVGLRELIVHMEQRVEYIVNAVEELRNLFV